MLTSGFFGSSHCPIVKRVSDGYRERLIGRCRTKKNNVGGQTDDERTNQSGPARQSRRLTLSTDIAVSEREGEGQLYVVRSFAADRGEEGVDG